MSNTRNHTQYKYNLYWIYRNSTIHMIAYIWLHTYDYTHMTAHIWPHTYDCTHMTNLPSDLHEDLRRRFQSPVNVEHDRYTWWNELQMCMWWCWRTPVCLYGKGMVRPPEGVVFEVVESAFVSFFGKCMDKRLIVNACTHIYIPFVCVHIIPGECIDKYLIVKAWAK